MQVKDAGEFALIDRLANVVAEENDQRVAELGQRGFRLVLSIGDDAAAWYAPAGVRVLTTDTMVEGVHFDLGYTGWRDLGWKSQVSNLSDVAAMGCVPLFSVVTLGLRGDLPVEGLLEMYRGMAEACRRFGGAIIGGDIVQSPVFFVTVAMEGAAAASTAGSDHPDALLTRHTARPGDSVAVTGHLGCSAGGLLLLQERRGGTEGRRLSAEAERHLLEAHSRPTPRIQEGVVLARLGVTTAMDVSDGLVDDLGKLCRASSVGAVIHAGRIPGDKHLRGAFPDKWLELALGGGEDYELLFTAPPNIMEKAVRSLETPLALIGEIVEGPLQVRVLDESGRPVPVSRGGWDHFRQ